MMETLKAIGSRIRELREDSNTNTEEMARLLKVPLETYRSYEDGVQDIPVSILMEIARKFGVATELLLTGEEPKMNIFTVTRSGQGTEVERTEIYRYQSLAGKFIHKKAEPYIVTVEPRKDTPSNYNHPGQEFEYVLEGSLKLTIHDHEIILNEGDSVFFDASYGHGLQALNNRPAKLLVVVM